MFGVGLLLGLTDVTVAEEEGNCWDVAVVPIGFQTEGSRLWERTGGGLVETELSVGFIFEG